MSLGLTYRYFRSKEDLVVIVYEGVAERVSKHVERLPHATIGERFQALFEHKLRLLAPHRDAFGALLSAAVDPSSKVAVLGDSSSRVRQAMELAFVDVVAHDVRRWNDFTADEVVGDVQQAADEGLVAGHALRVTRVAHATDAPSPDVTRAVALVLYAAHFALLLVWVHDETRGARRTRELLGTLRDTIVFVRPLLGAPGATIAMTLIADALAPILWKETST